MIDVVECTEAFGLAALERSANLIMTKRNFDLKASTPGEKWFERAVNHALGLWFSVLALILGASFTIIYYLSPSSHLSLMIHFGPFWMMLALVHFERYQARKAFLRLLSDGSLPSGDGQPSENPDAEHDVTPNR